MKQGQYHRARRLGSAMGRLAPNDRFTDASAVFRYAAELAVSRRLVQAKGPRVQEHALAFADAFLVSWFRARGERARALQLRRAAREVSESLLQTVADARSRIKEPDGGPDVPAQG